MRVLMVTQPGDGHLNPMVPVAQTLLAAGHEVEVATSPSYVADVEAAGLTGVGIGPAFRWDSALDRWPDAADVLGDAHPHFWMQRVNRDITVPFVTELCPFMRAHRPDLLVAEYAAALWAQAAHDLEGVPFAVTSWATEPGHEPADPTEMGVNTARAQLGLAPIATIEEINPARWITFTPPRWGAVDGPPLDTTRRYRLPTDPSEGAVPANPNGPFVYATLGTVFNTMRRLLKTFIAAIDDGGWDGLVTVGRTNDPARFDAPPRVAVEQYVPQADVLAFTDVFVCHGGLGSMLGAMGAGVPMVVVPLGADQLDNAARAERLGIARVIDPAVVTAELLRDTIQEVLESRAQRAMCEELRREVAAMPALHELVDDLQKLVI